MSRHRWGGLHLSRSLLPTATFITEGGHIREVSLTEADLLAIIRDAAHALGQRQEAREWNLNGRDGTGPTWGVDINGAIMVSPDEASARTTAEGLHGSVVVVLRPGSRKWEIA